MTRRTVLVVVVALVVVTAGCSAFDSTPDPDPDPDREPYDVADDLEPGLLPGLTEDGVTDRAALASATHRALENTPYKSYIRRTVDTEADWNVTVYEMNQTVTADAVSRHTKRSASADRDPQAIVETHTWMTDDVEYTRTVSASGNVTYEPTARIHGPAGLPISLLELYDATDSVTVNRTGDTERYRLEGSGDFQPVENASFELVLAESGYVDQYRVEGTAQRNGERATVEYVGGFEPLSDPDLEEPEWLEEAIEATDGR